MDKQEILVEIKALQRRGSYDDETLLTLIKRVMRDLKRYGVAEEVLNDEMSIGVISQGVYEQDTLKKYTEDFFKEVSSLRELGGK